MFLDYMLIIKTSYFVMEFYLNVSLKQSTYTVSTQSLVPSYSNELLKRQVALKYMYFLDFFNLVYFNTV